MGLVFLIVMIVFAATIAGYLIYRYFAPGGGSQDPTLPHDF